MARSSSFTSSLAFAAAALSLCAACSQGPESFPEEESATAQSAMTSTAGGSTGSTSTRTGADGRATDDRTAGGDPTGGATSPQGGPGDKAPPPVFDVWINDPTRGLQMPCDFPGRGGIQIYECYGDDAAIVNTAMDLAAYNVWRVRQVLEKVEKSGTFAGRDELWRTYFTGSHEADNPSLHNWFGAYSDARFKAIKYAYDEVWKTYLGPGWKTKRISCDCTSKMMSAHAVNAYGIEVCPKFFDKSIEDQARLLVHEFMHDVEGEETGNIQDTHKECEIDPNDEWLQKCYSDSECLKLAKDHPNVAVENPQNYGRYARELGEAYQAKACTNLSLCSPRDNGAPGCRPVVEVKPTYPECEGDPGSVGCPCVDVDIVAASDSADDGGFPDGEGSFLANKKPGGQFCHEPNVVCGKTRLNGKDFPICKSCDQHPEIGCPCTSQYECGDDLSCWGSNDMGFQSIGVGTCLPKETAKLEQLPWFCLDNCASISIDGKNGAACVYRQVPYLELDHGTCVNFATSCGEVVPGLCEQAGKICRIDPKTKQDVCVAECKTKADCAKNGFPDTYECDAEGKLGYQNGHCVPAGCGSDASAYCNLFR